MIHKKATEDKCDSSLAYLPRYRVMYHQPAQNLKNLPRPTPGTIIDDLERQIRTNSNKGSYGKLIPVHTKATEDRCDTSWTYLSIYIYHQPAQDLQNLPRSTTRPLIDNLERHVPAQTLAQALGTLFGYVVRCDMVLC